MSKTPFDRPLDRRQFLGRAAGVGAGLAAWGGLGRRPALAADADELRILFAGGTWKDFFEKTFVAPFTGESKAKIVWKTGLGFEPLVIAQRRKPQWDVIHQNQNTSSQLGALGVVIEWTEDRLPNLKKIHPSFRFPTIAGKTHTPYGLAVNTKRITKPINSWNDLFDPAYAGKVAFPEWTWVGDEVFYAINTVYGGAEDNIDPGIAKLKDLYQKNNGISIKNVEHTIQLLVAEEVWICPFFSARVLQAKQKGAPVEFVVPTEGGLSWVWNTSVLANRPKESIDLAFKFVNRTLDAEKQIEFSRLTSYPPTNMEAIANLPPDLKHLEISKTELEALGVLQRKLDYMAMFASRDATRDRWNKEVLAGKS
ncbi:MAG: ABC transporter substrate-binding protein [Pseudomonadota bacterium]